MRRLTWMIPALVLAALWCAPGAEAQRAQPRIISGSDVPIGAYPFQVALYRNGGFICGGSIRDSTHVITAAHCVTQQTLGLPHTISTASFQVGYGSAARSSHTKVSVSSIAVPGQYTAALNADESYDVAVLTLGTPIDLTGPNARAIPLAQPSQSKTTGSATVTGWGNTSEGGSSSQTLKGTTVPLRLDSACSIYGASYVAARAVCAGGGSLASSNPDTCQGDSGGPLVVDEDPDPATTTLVLLGITSFGDGCGRQDTPAAYTWTQGNGVASFIGSPAGDRSPPVVDTPAPPPPAVPVTALRDTTRPTARVSRLRCSKKRRCSFRIATADRGGSVRKLSAKVTRRVRTCKRRGDFRVCKVTTRRKTLKPRRIRGGFAFTAKLSKATYKLTAVATDAAGNRSRVARRTFRVR